MRTRSALVVSICVLAGLTSCRSENQSASSTSVAATTTAPAAGNSQPAGTTASSPPSASVAGSFGSLKDVCGPGSPTASPTQGVTASEIDVSTFTDEGFTKTSEMPDTAAVFTAWCNAAGGINGRKIVSHTRDARLTEDRQRMIEACKSDFAVVGGGAAFDQAGVKDRLTCLMPEIPAQVVSVANAGSDLQVLAAGKTPGYNTYEGYFGWLINEQYPDSKSAVGIISGDTAVTKDIGGVDQKLFEALGGTVTYNDLYPATGVTDWTPYAQAIKDGGVKGLVYLGDYRNLAKLEQSLTDIGYTLDWIDANSNAYNPEFITLGGANLAHQTNYADLGVYPIEVAAQNPATQSLIDLFKQYKPGATITLPAINAFSSWLLFAVSARDCGDQLTRRCLYDNATKTVAGWDGGGLTTPADTTDSNGKPRVCWAAVQATPTGWTVPDFKATDGFFRCTTYTIPSAPNGKPKTLADYGKTLDDVK